MRRVLPLLTAVGLLAASAAPSAAQETATVDAFVVPIEATIVPIERTVVSLDGSSQVVEEEDETVLRLAADVFFAFDSAALSPEADGFLRDDVGPQLSERAVGPVAVEGHTDAVGSDEYNAELSTQRAEAVAVVLREQLPGVEVTTEGFGETVPVASNETEDGEDDPVGRQRNRRVEIRFATDGPVDLVAPDVPGELPDPATAPTEESG